MAAEELLQLQMSHPHPDGLTAAERKRQDARFSALACHFHNTHPFLGSPSSPQLKLTTGHSNLETRFYRLNEAHLCSNPPRDWV